jgi:ADP-dependent NAD(P)H-hydrate dehydratase
MPPSDPLVPRLPQRPVDGHKGTFGHVLVVGSCRSMPGAAALVAMSAGRSGAGLVTVATSASAYAVTAGFAPWFMTVPLPEDSGGTIAEIAWETLAPLVQQATVVAIGPGLGKSRGLNRLVGRLYRDLTIPVVVDADGLNALAADEVDLRRHAGPRVLTPHPGELARLLRGAGLTKSAGARDRELLEPIARELAADRNMVMVVKSHQTLVTDGQQDWRCAAPANPGMATGGTGDVLTGMIAALIAQGQSPVQAAVTGVAIHASAGGMAASRLGPISMVATDLIDSLPEAFRKLSGT